MADDAARVKHREAMRRYRANLKAAGKPTRPPLTNAEREQQREYMRRRRAVAAKSGTVLAADSWRLRNPEKHQARVRRYRAENADRQREVARVSQVERRSTPWGRINNRIWPIMHGGIRSDSARASKYTAALGYTWRELRTHLEANFQPGMSWENWGEVWEVDHIKPVSAFKYVSLDDPLFKKAWRLENLRPLWRIENASKGSKIL